jgi:transcriptional regulator with XRE-family HTH domain
VAIAILFTHSGMSPRSANLPSPPRVNAVVARLASDLGREIGDERRRRRWTLAALARRAGVSVAMAQGVEAGEPSSLSGYTRLALALGLTPRFTLLPERVARAERDVDPVHAAMGELEAAHLRPLGYPVSLDEPYQHYQFAGRGDVVAVAAEQRALLHLENRTRFPDIQGFAGSWNTKRAYLAASVAQRFGIPDVRTQTHVVVALWSSEVLHSIRLREQTFRSLCPDATYGFEAWWSGTPPTEGGSTSSLVILDPLPGQRRSRRRWVGLDLVRSVAPRYRGYAEALSALQEAHVA